MKYRILLQLEGNPNLFYSKEGTLEELKKDLEIIEHPNRFSEIFAAWVICGQSESPLKNTENNQIFIELNKSLRKGKILYEIEENEALIEFNAKSIKTYEKLIKRIDRNTKVMQKRLEKAQAKLKNL